MARAFVVCAFVALVAGFAAVSGRHYFKKPFPASDSPVPAFAHAGAPVDEQEAMVFGLELETAVAERDRATVERLLALSDVLKRATSDLSEDKFFPDLRAAFAKRVSDELLALPTTKGSYKLLRVRTVNDRPRLLFRILTGTAAANYHDIALGRNEAGHVVLDDIDVMTMGEPLGQTMRRLAIDYLNARYGRGATDRDRLIGQHSKTILEFNTKVTDGKGADAMAAYRRLPPELRKDKGLQLIAITAARQVSDATYVELMDAYRRDHPDEPNCDLVTLDALFLTFRFEKAVDALDRLRTAVGGDAYLDAMKAAMLAELGRFEDARTTAERAVHDEPTLTEAYWARALIAIKEKDHAGTLAWLKKVVEDRHETLNFATMVRDRKNAAFCASPQFQELRQWYQNRGR